METFSLPEGFERNHLFMDQTRHFIDVLHGAQPVCTLEDGTQALRLALAAKESQNTGRAISFR